MNKNISLMLPQYWPAWLGLSILWLIIRLPNSWQIRIGTTLGHLLYFFPTKLKKITVTNIKLCFPKWTTEQQTHLAKKSFASLGIGVIETARAWWLSEEKLQSTLNIHGWEHAESAFAKGNGIILVSPHFTCLESIARLLGMQHPFATLYRPHKKRFISYLHERFRRNKSIQFIPRHHIRELIRTLHRNIAVWYAYDVDGGRKRSVFAPFFNIPTASLTTVSRLVELSGAAVLPVHFYRHDKHFNYEIFIEKSLEPFPSGDLTQDATLLNAILESAIRKKPEQYIWQYKRFKTRPEGEKRFY